MKWGKNTEMSIAQLFPVLSVSYKFTHLTIIPIILTPLELLNNYGFASHFSCEYYGIQIYTGMRDSG